MKLEQMSVNKGAFGISGEVALITGASSGPGRACAITPGSAGSQSRREPSS